MIEYGSDEAVRQRAVVALGEEAGELYHLLWRDVAWLNLKWSEARGLFASGSGRIDLMNRTAPEFFADLERLVWLDIALHLCRITDPAANGKNQRNVSLRALESRLPTESRAAMALRLHAVDSATTFARTWRNKFYAHSDLDVATKRNATPLEGGSLEKVNGAIRAIVEAVNWVELRFGLGPIAYEMQQPALAGAQALLEYLDEGLAASEMREESSKLRNSRYL